MKSFKYILALIVLSLGFQTQYVQSQVTGFTCASSTTVTGFTLATGSTAPSCSSGVVTAPGGSNSTRELYTATTLSNDQYSQAIQRNSTDISGAGVRMQSNGDGYYFFPRINSIYLLAAAGNVQITGACSSSSVGDTIKLAITGSTLTAYINGTVACSGSNSSLTSGAPGFLLDNTNGAQLDTWQAGSASAPLVNPVFSPTNSTFLSTQNVSASGPSGSTICYTTNGTNPTAGTAGTCDQSTYSTTLVFSATTTLKAISTQAGQVNSGITTGLYTKHLPLTYYVDPINGGPRDSTASRSAGLTATCTGLGITPFSSGGTVGQSCPYSEAEDLWNDPYVYQDNHWIMLGGDTVIVKNCAFSGGTGCKMSGATPAASAGDHCFGIGITCEPPVSWPSNVYLQGENAGACRSSQTVPNNPSTSYTSADPTKVSYLWGAAHGSSYTLGFRDTQNATVSCIGLIDHDSCGPQASPYAPGHQSALCGSDWISYGIQRGDNNSALNSNITLTDVIIEGFQAKGMIGNIGGPWYYNYVSIFGNGQTGDDFDNGSANLSSGSLTLFHFYLAFNGCSQEYPFTHTIPYANCLGQSGGGQGDGWGSPTSPFDVSCNYCGGWYNTQDWLDFGHSYGGNISVTNSFGIGNMGGNIKVGPAASITAINNLINSNCRRMAEAMTGTDPYYNINLTDYCRPASSTAGGTNVLANSPIIQGSITASGTTVTGVSSHFLADVSVGDILVPNGSSYSQGRAVTAIASDTSLTIASSFPSPPTSTFVSRVRGTPASTSTVYRYFNTIWTYAQSFWDDQCQGIANLAPPTAPAGQAQVDSSLCPGYVINDRNNIYFAISNPSYNSGTTPSFYAELAPSLEDYNLCYNLHSAQCVNTHDLTSSPAFVSQPSTTMTAESNMDNVNFTLSSISPAIASGITISGITTDYFSLTRPGSNPTRGAIEYSPVTVLNVKITGNIIMKGKAIIK